MMTANERDVRVRQSLYFAWSSLLVTLCWLLFPVSGEGAIHYRSHPRVCVAWAAEQLAHSLRSAEIAAGEEDIVIEQRHLGRPVESFSISIQGTHVLVSGSDCRGEMYGVLELAEQITNGHSHGSWRKLVSRLKPTQQSPFLPFRADNAFIRASPTSFSLWAERLHLRQTPLLFPDVGMWERYIDMLAANRFNTLDLHGGYNLRTTQFFNLLPALVAVPGYSGAGNVRTQDRNLSTLRHLVRYAKKRGVDLGLMNYSAAIRGLSRTQLVDYTKKAVSLLQTKLPELKRLGFRVGESGEELSFFQDTYVPAVKESGRRDLRLYTRSWRTTPETMKILADSLGGALDVEVKYNGEHLGLPYQAILGPAHSRYSYEGFLQPDAHYRVIWQVRANGTHRYWTWAQTEFVRRTVQSFKFGNAGGFTLESPCAYFTSDAAPYYTAPEDKYVFKYIWEKHWPWYFAWGRLAYNPDLATQTIVDHYLTRFGRQGSRVYQALQESGKIVPMAMSYRFVGPDQRNVSPETQTGAFDPEKSEPIDALSFARNTPMDSRSFVGIDTFVNEKVDGLPDGRIGPTHVARLFASAALRARHCVTKVRNLKGRDLAEWRLMKTDVLGACDLGDYYASRILGTMYLDWALRVNNPDDYQVSLEYLGRSRLAWRQLSQTCDSVYEPLHDPLLRQTAYRWGSQIGPLRALDASVAALWAKRPSRPEGKRLILTSRELGERFNITVDDLQAVEANGEIKFRCTPIPAADVENVTLWLKELPSAARWTAFPMARDPNGAFSITVRTPQSTYLCLLGIVNTDKSAAQFPFALQKTPYWVISQ